MRKNTSTQKQSISIDQADIQTSVSYQKPKLYFLGSLEQVQGDRFGDYYDASGRRY